MTERSHIYVTARQKLTPSRSKETSVLNSHSPACCLRQAAYTHAFTFSLLTCDNSAWFAANRVKCWISAAATRLFNDLKVIAADSEWAHCNKDTQVCVSDFSVVEHFQTNMLVGKRLPCWVIQFQLVGDCKFIIATLVVIFNAQFAAFLCAWGVALWSKGSALSQGYEFCENVIIKPLSNNYTCNMPSWWAKG